MAKPLVAIVGRPNVGKSTFFNQMAGRRVAIVEDTPGVTRDRVYADCEWQKYKFTLIDTGGIDPNSEDPLLKQMRRQAEIAIETCDVILFFVDGKQGLTADDADVADLLRKSGKPVMLVVNKLDNPKRMEEIYDFYQLGMGEPIPISSVNLLNMGDLLDAMSAHFPDPDMDEEEFENSTLAIANCWTALCFAPLDLVRAIPYRRVDAAAQIGFEDWAWNVETAVCGAKHKIVPGTVHAIRSRANSLGRDAVARSSRPEFPPGAMAFFKSGRRAGEASSAERGAKAS